MRNPFNKPLVSFCDRAFAVTLLVIFLLMGAPLLLMKPAGASVTLPAAVSFSTTVGAASAAILPANNARRYLLIQNVCASNIGINPTAGTAAIGTAGTFTLFPGGSWEFRDADVPRGAMTAISASGTCGISIIEMQ